MSKFVFNFLTVFLFSITMISQNVEESVEENLIWYPKFEKATKFSKKQHKPILIFFTGSDWCGPCKKLEKDFFSSSKFKTIADEEFILYKADFPRNLDLVTDSQREINIELKSKYDVRAFPTIIFINSKGDVIGKRKGYNLMRDTSYHYALIDKILNK